MIVIGPSSAGKFTRKSTKYPNIEVKSKSRRRLTNFQSLDDAMKMLAPAWSSPFVRALGLYTVWCTAGLTAFYNRALLRGNCGPSKLSLTLLRMYLFSVGFFPLCLASKILGTFSLLYLPMYADLSEHTRCWSNFSTTFNFPFVEALFRAYFSKLEVVKTTDIENPTIFGLHPHGILPFGGMINFASDRGQFRELFPHLRNRMVLAASACFLVPGYRELLLSHRVRDCSRFDADEWLSMGYSIAIVPGGASEALFANPDVDMLDMQRRRGFIRLALRFGTQLCPCYTFNEVDFFSQLPENSLPPLLQSTRKIFQKTFGISFPILLNLFPRTDSRVVTVVGEPISVPLITNPSEDEIQHVMDAYIAALQKLYDKHALKFNSKPRSLVIK